MNENCNDVLCGWPFWPLQHHAINHTHVAKYIRLSMSTILFGNAQSSAENATNQFDFDKCVDRPGSHSILVKL